MQVSYLFGDMTHLGDSFSNIQWYEIHLVYRGSVCGGISLRFYWFQIKTQLVCSSSLQRSPNALFQLFNWRVLRSRLTWNISFPMRDLKSRDGSSMFLGRCKVKLVENAIANSFTLVLEEVIVEPSTAVSSLNTCLVSNMHGYYWEAIKFVRYQLHTT